MRTKQPSSEHVFDQFCMDGDILEPSMELGYTKDANTFNGLNDIKLPEFLDNLLEDKEGLESVFKSTKF